MPEATYSAGVQRYIDQARAATKTAEAYKKEMRQCRFDTIAVHGVYSVEHAVEQAQGSIIEPMFLSSAQAFRDSDEMEAALAYEIPSWTYSRIHNPTFQYLEMTLALLESYGSEVDASALATSSGMSAIFMATDPFLVRQGDEQINFVATAQCYGGTFLQFTARRQQEQGIDVRFVTDPLKLEDWESKIDSNTRFIYGEMPSNPGQSVFDIAAVAEIAHAHGIPLIIDTTVATPALMRPLAMGADIVVHSMSKSMMMSGLGIGGAVISRKDIVSDRISDELRQDFAFMSKLLPFRDYGPCISPFNAAMALSELKTLRTRMAAVSRNAQQVAEFLDSHPGIEQVNYLGLESHPLHDLAKKQMMLVDSDQEPGGPEHLFGHLMSFDVKGGAGAARNVFDGFRRIFRATDLGRIKSVATIPAISTHQQQGEEGRALAGIPANQIRLSVGGENPLDVINDLDTALSA